MVIQLAAITQRCRDEL